MATKISLNITECSLCGVVFWDDTHREAMVITGGPCCFGHPQLDVEHYPTERAAMAAYPAWNRDRAHRWEHAVERMAMEDPRR